MNVEKLEVDGEVAVMISKGFGAGWSTWNSGCEEFFMFDKTLCEMFLAKKSTESIASYIENIFGDEYVCTLGIDTVEVVWLDKGTAFNIDEYDGSESLVTVAFLHHTA